MTDEKRHDPAKRRVHTDEHGHSVLDGTVNTGKFELVSTQRLKALLEDEKSGHRESAAKLADSDQDGYLAQDSSGHLQIIDDDELQSLLDASHPAPAKSRPATVAPEPATADDDEELSLVSTQRLRKLLDIPEGPGDKAAEKPIKDEIGGFDPYNSS